jgi:hypothetical protein
MNFSLSKYEEQHKNIINMITNIYCEVNMTEIFILNKFLHHFPSNPLPQLPFAAIKDPPEKRDSGECETGKQAQRKSKAKPATGREPLGERCMLISLQYHIQSHGNKPVILNNYLCPNSLSVDRSELWDHHPRTKDSMTSWTNTMGWWRRMLRLFYIAAVSIMMDDGFQSPSGQISAP